MPIGPIIALAGGAAAVVAVTTNKRKNRELLDKLEKSEKQRNKSGRK